MDSNDQLTFLLVEKDIGDLDHLATIIHEMGYSNYLQAEDGAEAWAMFNNFEIDFVVCGEDVPEIKGLDLLRVIRSDQNYALIPFVLLAEKVTTKLVFRAGKAGVSNLIVQPFKKDVFKRKIEEVLEERNNPQVQAAEKSFKRGIEMMKAGRENEALKVFEEVLSVYEHAEVYYNLGYIKTVNGDYEEAIRCFRRATLIDNDFARAYQKMGEALERLGRTEEAAESYSKAGDIYMERKQDNEAEEIYETVTRLRPDTTNVYNSLGIIYRRRGRYQDAVLQFQKAVKVHPLDEYIYFNISRAYLDLNDFGNAQKMLAKALELNPNFGPALELHRAVEMGLTLQI